MHHLLIALAFIGFVFAPVVISVIALCRKEEQEHSRPEAVRLAPVVVTDPVSANHFQGPRKNAAEHGTVQAARVRVAERRVVAAKKGDTVRQPVLRPVAERKRRLTVDDLRPRKVREIAVPRDLAQADYDAHARQRAKLSGQVPAAVPDLVRPRLVSRRGTAHYGTDPKVMEAQAVVTANSAGPARQPQLMKDRVHEVAAPVAGERTPRAVRPVSAGSETEHVDARARVAETWNGTGPVHLLPVSTAPNLADTAAILAETQATLAACNLLVKHLERRILELSARAS